MPPATKSITSQHSRRRLTMREVANIAAECRVDPTKASGYIQILVDHITLQTDSLRGIFLALENDTKEHLQLLRTQLDI